MSPRGYPDWTTPVTQITTGGFAGLEELAARLGSIVPWDMEGNIILMEDFGSELTGWLDDSSAGTSEALRSSRRKYSGDWSVKLYNAGGAGIYSTILKWIAFAGINKQGVFARFCVDVNHQIISLRLLLLTGKRAVIVQAKYNHLLETLTVFNNAGADEVVAESLGIQLPEYRWIPFYFTYDLSTGYYGKVSINETEFDISHIPFRDTAATIYKNGVIEAKTIATEAGAFTAYVDDIVLVKNVP